jgi:hypothetical protein
MEGMASQSAGRVHALVLAALLPRSLFMIDLSNRFFLKKEDLREINGATFCP